MKHLALIATVAALAIPASAQAAQDHNNKEWYAGKTTVKVKVQDEQRYKTFSLIPADNETRTYDLEDGNKLHLEGEAAYLVSDSGNKFFAPDGEYHTTNGIKYQTEDGLILYATPEAEMYMIEGDIQDNDNDGYADDVDVDIEKFNN